MAETRTRASGIVTPTRGAARLTVSLDTLRLERDATGLVTGSRRVAGSPDQDAGKETGLLLTEAAERTASAVAGLQSAVAQVHEWRDGDGLPVSRRAELLARVETPGGPVLLGTSGPGDPAGLVEALPWDELGALSAPFVPADPPEDWRERPLLLRPSAASVLVAGAAFSLTSRGGRATAARLAGRRILPQLTLTDLPSAPPESGPDGPGQDASGLDDRGDPALPTVLVDGGRICPPPRSPRASRSAGPCGTTTPAGSARRRWPGSNSTDPGPRCPRTRWNSSGAWRASSATTATAPSGSSAWPGSRTGPAAGSASPCGASPSTCCAGPAAWPAHPWLSTATAT